MWYTLGSLLVQMEREDRRTNSTVHDEGPNYQKDKNDYVIELKRIGPVIKLNNKEFPTEGWMMVSIQIQQIIEKEVMPDIPVPAPQIQQPPGQGQVPVPGAVPAQQPMPGVVPPQQPVTGTGTGEQQAASVVRLDSDPASLLNHCYWMNSSSGKNIWELTPYNKLDCFKMDSCDGGQGRSGGGCYKWAASPDADRLPW